MTYYCRIDYRVGNIEGLSVVGRGSGYPENAYYDAIDKIKTLYRRFDVISITMFDSNGRSWQV